MSKSDSLKWMDISHRQFLRIFEPFLINYKKIELKNKKVH